VFVQLRSLISRLAIFKIMGRFFKIVEPFFIDFLKEALKIYQLIFNYSFSSKTGDNKLLCELPLSVCCQKAFRP